MIGLAKVKKNNTTKKINNTNNNSTLLYGSTTIPYHMIHIIYRIMEEVKKNKVTTFAWDCEVVGTNQSLY